MKIRIVLFLLFVVLCFSCTTGKTKSRYVIGVSFGNWENDVWQETLLRDLKAEAAEHPEIRLKFVYAKHDTHEQIAQIHQLMKEKVDLMIISPNETRGITPVAEEVYHAGIPTIIIDRKILSDQYTTYIGPDNYEIGHHAAVFACTQLQQRPASVLEIWGNQETSSALLRHLGFREVMDAHPDIHVFEIRGDWQGLSIPQLIDTLSCLNRIDLVYAHNDVMALAARNAIAAKDTALVNRIRFIGVDALTGKGMGVEAVAEGKLAATFYNPISGSTAIHIAMQILQGEPVAKQYALNSAMIDKNNAGTIYLQSNRLLDYQEQIERQQNSLTHLLSQYDFLESSITIILILMIALIVLVLNTIRINKKIRRKNRQLFQTNQQVEQQKEELAEANRRIQEATAIKLQFFTNVSHEIKTPLTLILGPLNKMNQVVEKNSPLYDDVQIMRKNAERLKRVIEQLLDFRKVENNKMNMKVRQVELVSFVREIKSYFHNLARSKRIQYELQADMDRVELWVDTDKMEKILVNLLSNAFKFTPEGGRICIHLQEDDQQVRMSVEDNGIGIPPENIASVFDKFFTGDQNYVQGTGIGLHLTKEFVQMHKGTVTVTSTPHEQTIFTVTIPKGNAHFDSACLIQPTVADLSSGLEQLDTSHIRERLAQSYDYTVLIVEDDADIASYLQRELAGNFHLLRAGNGVEALDVLQNHEVQLVLSDVMMPKMNGFELCKQIKESMDFSHIPVILLTALNDDHQRMYGIAEGADDYIPKPFNLELVKLRILQVIEERQRLRERFSQQLNQLPAMTAIDESKQPAPDTSLPPVNTMNDRFLQRFVEMLETHYNDPDFNIEKGSERLGLSRVHLYRKVKEVTGLSPTDFLRNFRLQKAAQLLSQRAATISEVAYSTGFSSPAYFAKCFKALYAITPTEYVNGGTCSYSDKGYHR